MHKLLVKQPHTQRPPSPASGPRRSEADAGNCYQKDALFDNGFMKGTSKLSKLTARRRQARLSPLTQGGGLTRACLRRAVKLIFRNLKNLQKPILRILPKSSQSEA
jgi:hypothetical protein